MKVHLNHRKARREQAAARLAKTGVAAVGATKRVEILDKINGEGVGATKERARLQTVITAAKLTTKVVERNAAIPKTEKKVNKNAKKKA